MTFIANEFRRPAQFRAGLTHYLSKGSRALRRWTAFRRLDCAPSDSRSATPATERGQRWSKKSWSGASPTPSASIKSPRVCGQPLGTITASALLSLLGAQAPQRSCGEMLRDTGATSAPAKLARHHTKKERLTSRYEESMGDRRAPSRSAHPRIASDRTRVRGRSSHRRCHPTSHGSTAQ